MGAFSYVCPICGNHDEAMIGIRNGKYYCRRCISFRGQEVEKLEDKNISKDAYYHLDYDLSEDQSCLSTQLVKNFKNKKNSLVHAVCGSGKTEIVLKVIQYVMSNGGKVGFCIPRRDVVIEIHERFSRIFINNSIALVYGGHTKILTADLVCCTTHQLFRYEHYFDLLILDEVDAFPFKDNQVLNSFFRRAIKGNFIIMSATPSASLINGFVKEGGQVLELFSRYHHYPLPVPEVIIHPKPLLIIDCIRLILHFQKRNKQVFIFTPTIAICESLFSTIKWFCKHGTYVHSKREDRDKVINDFKDNKYQYIVTTAVLERGVTVKDLQVIVYLADHSIYNSYTLVQIAGRVGRKKDAPEGRVIYLAQENNKFIDQSISDISTANKNLQNLFSTNNATKST